MSPPVRTLYRPVGLRELELVLDSDARAFPPRLPEQPIFYPVLNSGYAEQIARDWNAPDEGSGHAGFVTAFDVDAAFLERYPVKVVGASQHQELWVPAEELDLLHAHLRSRIRVTHAFYGASYRGPQPLPYGLKGKDLRQQLHALCGMRDYSTFDFTLEVSAQWKLVLINFGFWSACPASEQGLGENDKTRALDAVAKAWAAKHADFPLPLEHLLVQG